MAAKKKKPANKVRPTPTDKPKVTAPLLKIEAGWWSRNWLPGLLLFVLAISLYAITIHFDYVLDDKIVFTENQLVAKGFSGIWELLTTESFLGYFGEQKDLVVGARYRPLSLVTFAMEHQYFGMNAKVSHLINVLLYGFTGLLLFRVVGIILPKPKQEYWWLGLPFVAALLFVAHPVHSEVVANVKGRDEILALLLALATLYCSLRYLASKSFGWVAGSVICFFLALLAKENALTFLAVIPLTIYCFSKAGLREHLVVGLPLLLTGLLYLWVRTDIIGYLLSSGKEITDIMNNPFFGLQKGEKFATIFYTLGQYLKLLFIPHPLTHDYYPYHIPVLQWSDLRPILAFLLNAGLLIYAFFGVWRKQVIAYGILLYFITLSIVSNIPFTVGTFMNERFIYMPSIGFCIAMAWLISRKLPDWVQQEGDRYNILSVGLLALMAGGFIGKTISRVPAWRSEMSLNRAAIKVSYQSARANCFMGTALYKEYLEESDQATKNALLEDINFYIDRSLEINPKYISALTMKAGVVAENYNRDADIDKLLADFYHLITNKPNLNYINEYVEYLIERGDQNDKLVEWCYKVGTFFLQNNQGQPQLGFKYLMQYGLQIAPNDPRLNKAVGDGYQLMDRPAEAQQYYERAQ